ncbi:hypothetical protein ACFQOY_13635 [Enterococcus alcedinis]|uniref:Phage tail protein n=1 Tax=Enterococcus alcedinis TaxID=1274384 RepID=A0A917N3S3_9ENTE|nr:hypothetical protein [Enterococcus alcedinis]MBP2100958.1 phage-related protein [Enterococcus alcedinis]GGI64746.1 hypothetical protein GCM10011482_04000 [Enterococcus alcedinis]
MIGYFEYKGQKSTEFDLMISEDISFTSPQIKGEFVPIDGMDGEILMSDGKLKNVPKKFYVLMDNYSQEKITRVSNWLKQDAHWGQLTTSIDPNYIYQAIFIDEYDFESTSEEYEKAILTFVCKPYKFLKTGLAESILGSTISNPTKRQARPKIIIKGTGNITLKIGSSLWEFKNVDGGIVIDTLLDVVTNLTGGVSAWDKITTYPLPPIQPGTHAVTKTGTITEIKIIPRWEVIV